MPLQYATYLYHFDGCLAQCMLCGCDITCRSLNFKGTGWLSWFRAVYIASDGASVSGVGLRRLQPNELWAPMDERVRTDTRGRVTPGLVHLARLPYSFEDIYLFHDRCWDRLASHYCLEELDYERLYAALQYMPLPDSCGHQPVDLEPPILEQLMYAPKPPPEKVGEYYTVGNPTDCFQRLPLELREMIAILLSTHEALDLRLASRAMIGIFASSFFWQTRFDINGERGHLAMVIEGLTVEERHELDWRLLYHYTCNLRCSADFFDANVEKWERLRWLRDTTAGGSRFRVGARDNSQSPHFDGRALQYYHNSHYRNTDIVTVDLSRSSVLKINVSILQLVSSHRKAHSWDWNNIVTGMEFIFDDGTPSVEVGYSTPGTLILAKDTPRESLPRRARGVLIDAKYPGLLKVHEVKPLRGFHIQRDRRASDNITDIYHFSEIPYSYFHRRERWQKTQISVDELRRCEALHVDEVIEVVITLNQEQIIDLGTRGKRYKRHYEPQLEQCSGPSSDSVNWDSWDGEISD
ncbi:hypothetical protein BDV19DRAFT_387256 [Aspergillus venezuelensis]